LDNIAVLWGVVLVLVLSGKTNPGPIVSFPSCTMHIGDCTSEQDSNAQIGSDSTYMQVLQIAPHPPNVNL
jgi:hypothetical protein